MAEWNVCEEIELQAIFMVRRNVQRRGWLKPGNIDMIVVCAEHQKGSWWYVGNKSLNKKSGLH